MGVINLAGTEWNFEGESLYIAVKGRLDTLRAMSLDEEFAKLPEEVKNIYFDFDELNYIASAGLRILFWAQEYTEDKGGEMLVKNVSDEVDDIFEMTGFKDIITIEKKS